MEKSNIKSLRVYISECILNSLMIIIVYKTTIFRCIGNLSYTLSEIVLYSLIAMLVIIGIAITAKQYRNSINTYLTRILPFGIYTCIAYINELKVIIIILSILSAAAIILLVISFARNNHILANKKNKANTLQLIMGSKNIISIASIILIAPMIMKVIFFNSLFTPDQVIADPRYEQWRVR